MYDASQTSQRRKETYKIYKHIVTSEFTSRENTGNADIYNQHILVKAGCFIQ